MRPGPYLIQCVSDGSFISQEVNGKEEYIRFESCEEAGKWMDGAPAESSEYGIVPEASVHQKANPQPRRNAASTDSEEANKRRFLDKIGRGDFQA
jgi:hypothetical protein